MKQLYMIGNTHFDPVWLWKWDEAMASIRATFRSALDRMKEDENFIYSFATPPVFEWIKNTDSQMFEEIKQRVAEGRWELAEGWWVQPDCYGATGESYVRQGLYAQKYWKENFGQMSNCVFNIDSFGHSPALPQILNKSHIDYYCFVRPEKHHISLDSPFFWWQGIDGSRVLTYRAQDAYSKNLNNCEQNQENQIDQDQLIVYGVTDHGGAPTKIMMQWINEKENAEFSRVDNFFEEHPACEYVVDKELLTGDFGPYSNYPKIKRMNRIAEYALLNAEKAALLNEKNENATLEKCWQDILFNQFHDILGGACMKEAYIDAENMLGRATITANEVMHYNLQQITRKMKTVGINPRDAWNIVVWNLNGCEYDGYIEAEVQWLHEFDAYDKGILLIDEEGQEYPCQIIQAKSVILGFRSRFVFKGKIPAIGYKMYRVVQTQEEPIKKALNLYEIKTEQLEIQISKETGYITGVFDKKNGQKLCSDIMVPKCYFDDGDTWCFNIDGYDENGLEFHFDDMRVIEAGELRTIIKGTYRLRDSLLHLYYTFYHQERYMDVAYRVNWNEKHYVLKLETKAEENHHSVAVPYGSVSREATKVDVPLGTFLKIGDLSMSADSIFSYNMIDKVLGLTVLRSAIYGDFRMGELDYEEDYDILSQGINEGKVRIDFNGDVHCMPECFLNPPVVIVEANHDGILPSEHGYYRVCGEGVSLSTIKQSEYEKDAVILRLIEQDGLEKQAEIFVGEKSYLLTFHPYEIKTVKLLDGVLNECYMTED